MLWFVIFIVINNQQEWDNYIFMFKSKQTKNINLNRLQNNLFSWDFDIDWSTGKL